MTRTSLIRADFRTASTGSPKGCWAKQKLEHVEFDPTYSVTKCMQGAPNLKNGILNNFKKTLVKRCMIKDKNGVGYQANCRGFKIEATRICKKADGTDCAIISFK